jgi:hypothetical protein
MQHGRHWLQRIHFLPDTPVLEVSRVPSFGHTLQDEVSDIQVLLEKQRHNRSLTDKTCIYIHMYIYILTCFTYVHI